MNVWMLRLYVALAIVFLAGPRAALACACCTNEGQRNVGTVALDSSKRQQIENLRFAGKAKLYTGEADVDSVEGIVTPSDEYAMTAAWRDNRLIFSLRDKNGRSGTLALPLPNSISMFEVDPRSGRDAGQGPPLYKEWKLSAPASASGVFAPGAGARHILSLIIHGGGNSCTDASSFTHWTLVMQGPKANYKLFGKLATPQ